MSTKIFLKTMVELYIAIFVKFLHDLKENNIFDAIISGYFEAYYNIFRSIFWGPLVHTNPTNRESMSHDQQNGQFKRKTRANSKPMNTHCVKRFVSKREKEKTFDVRLRTVEKRSTKKFVVTNGSQVSKTAAVWIRDTFDDDQSEYVFLVNCYDDDDDHCRTAGCRTIYGRCTNESSRYRRLLDRHPNESSPAVHTSYNICVSTGWRDLIIINLQNAVSTCSRLKDVFRRTTREGRGVRFRQPTRIDNLQRTHVFYARIPFEKHRVRRLRDSQIFVYLTRVCEMPFRW
jgi:hypothetical protein